MKKLYEFDSMVTPEEWINQALNNKQEEKNDNITPIRSNRKRRTPTKVMFVAAVLIVMSCVSVLAYGVTKGHYNLKIFRSFNGIFDSASKDKIQDIDNLVTDGGLIVRCTRVVADSTRVYFRVEVETEDGSPLYENTETRWTILSAQSFADVELLVDGEVSKDVTSYSQRRVDDASVDNKAEFEIGYTTTNSLIGKDITLNLSGYNDYCRELLNIKPTFNTLKDLLDAAEFADESEFLPCTGSGQTKIYYQPEVGNLHIKFSAEYPDSYIDNVGIYKCSENNDTQGLYIGITMGSFDDYHLLKRLVAINKNTGESRSHNISEAYGLGWQRIVLLVIPDEDGADFTKEMLDEYILCCLDSKNSGSSLRYKGNWNFNIRLDENKIGTIKKAENLTLYTQLGELNVSLLQIQDMDITIQGTIDYSIKLSDYSQSDYLYPELVMSDGSVKTISKCPNSIIQSSQGNEYSMTWNLSQIINAEDVVGVKVMGNTIDLQ